MVRTETPPLPPKRCLGCGYILEGLPENRCPECGRAFDPGDPETYAVQLTSGRSYLLAALAGVMAMAIPLIAAKLVDLQMFASDWVAALLLVPLMAAGLSTEAIVLDASIRKLRRSPSGIRHRRSMFAAMLISLLVIIMFLAAFLLPSWSSGPR